MKLWKCEICPYVYDEEKGDPDNDLLPKTPFAELPDDWECPVCGVSKEYFSQVSTEEDTAEDKEDIVKHYSNDQLTVIWKPKLCDHNGNCTRRLPEVFDADRRPWVDISKADPDTIKEVVEECPTGALTFETPEDEAG
jgi:rubredoxin/uncharacterized Fe-S cluster protein YjdI